MPPLATNLWTQTFPFYDYPHALISAAGYLWIGNQSNTGSIIRVDPNNPTAWTGLVFPNDVWHQWCSDVIYIASKNKVYCLLSPRENTGNYTTISEVDPTTLAFTDVIQTGSYCAGQGSLACDGTYLYVAAREIANVYKYRISDWVLVDTLLTNMPLGHCIRYDNGKLYVTSSNQVLGTLSVIEIATSSFTITQSVVIDHDRVFTDDMAITSDYLWLGSETTGNIVRVSRSNLNNQLVINTGMTARNFGVYFDGEGIWTGWEGSPGIYGRLNTTTLGLQLFQFSDANQYSPNEFLRIGSVMYFTHYHEGGTLTAIGVAGTIPPLTPGAILVSDRITLSDALVLFGPDPTGISFLDSINLVDQIFTSRPQETPNTDTLTLSDNVVIRYFGDFSFSDSVSLGDTFGVWNTTYFETLSLSDAIAYSLDLPAALEFSTFVQDSYQLFDSIAYSALPRGVAVGDLIYLRDGQRVILNSTLDGYLRRYLNDVRR